MKMKPLLLAAAMVASGLTVTVAQAKTVTSDMPVKIEIENACEISTAPTELDFGVQGVLSANIDQFSNLYVTCTTDAVYDIGLDGGASEDTTARTMKKDTDFVSYQLYTDAGRGTVWGDTVGTDSVNSTGTGTEQNFPVYGRVSPQVTPPTGVYNDTITVTVTY